MFAFSTIRFALTRPQCDVNMTTSKVIGDVDTIRNTNAYFHARHNNAHEPIKKSDTYMSFFKINMAVCDAVEYHNSLCTLYEQHNHLTEYDFTIRETNMKFNEQFSRYAESLNSTNAIYTRIYQSIDTEDMKTLTSTQRIIDVLTKTKQERSEAMARVMNTSRDVIVTCNNFIGIFDKYMTAHDKQMNGAKL